MIPMPQSMSLTGGAGGDSGDSTTKGGNVGGNVFDNSGWNLTFGANSGIESSRAQSTPGNEYVKYALIGGAFLLALRWLKNQKK